MSSQFSWGSEVTESEVVEEAQQAEQQEEAFAEPEAVALTADDFAALEERILRTVNLVKRERTARAAAEERAAQAESLLTEQIAIVEQTQKEVSALRVERDHVRQRVERLLGQLDALEL
jgi:hypothetical protein